MRLWQVGIFIWTWFGFCFCDGYVESVGDEGEINPPDSELQVAMACRKGGKYHSQYMNAAGHWVSDLETKVGCLHRKDDILDYCKKVYPHSEITNIVESTHTVIIDDWCKIGNGKCMESFKVRPYRCLEGKFQSDALLVPEPCQFDHIHNNSQCMDFYSWNITATASCQTRNMAIRSFAMLLPCGTDVFTGVEFVCCPLPDGVHTEMFTESPKLTTAKAPTKTPWKMPKDDRDPYFTHFDSRIEHDAFKSAEHRVDAKHHKKVEAIMNEWNILEEKYMKMKLKNPTTAEKFKLKMTGRFSKMMNALKEESSAEKRQMVNLHQQRIIAQINERKKTGMTCLVNALNAQHAVMLDIEKCLNHLLKALYKDRHHTIAHFNHLMMSSPKEAHREQSATIEHLEDIDRMANESINLLDRYPAFRDEILPDAEHLITNLRLRDTLPVELSKNSLAYDTAVNDHAKITDQNIKDTIIATEDLAKRQKLARHEQMRHDIHLNQFGMQKVDMEQVSGSLDQVAIDVTVAERVEEPRVAHVASNRHSLGPATFVQQTATSRGFSEHMMVVGAVVGLALVSVMLVALVLRRSHTKHTKHGFIEVSQTMSPEERHVAQMRVNGYENPTYKYFETK